jgi:hypothetical protein
MKGRQRKNFDFPAKRRREIVPHGRYVGAAQTEDFSRWLIAWVWHNPKAKDQIWSVMECAKNMGGKISEAEASAIIEEASTTRKRLSADNLARFLGVTYAQRQALRLTTIGSVNVGKRARKEMRKRSDRLAKEAKRRAAGMRPQSQSLSATKPWRELGMSRAAWYRRNKARRKGETVLSAAIFLSSAPRNTGACSRASKVWRISPCAASSRSSPRSPTWRRRLRDPHPAHPTHHHAARLHDAADHECLSSA